MTTSNATFCAVGLKTGETGRKEVSEFIGVGLCEGWIEGLSQVNYALPTYLLLV
jgi:hypothetical protein